MHKLWCNSFSYSKGTSSSSNCYNKNKWLRWLIIQWCSLKCNNWCKCRLNNYNKDKYLLKVWTPWICRYNKWWFECSSKLKCKIDLAKFQFKRRDSSSLMDRCKINNRETLLIIMYVLLCNPFFIELFKLKLTFSLFRCLIPKIDHDVFNYDVHIQKINQWERSTFNFLF